MYGPSDNFEHVYKQIPDNKKNDYKYFIRCVPKDFKNQDILQIQRKAGISLTEAEEFYNQLPNGPDLYTVQLFETWQPDYSGGLIINQGLVKIDLHEGDKYFIEPKGEQIDRVRGASMDIDGVESDKFDIHLNYGNSPTEAEKLIMVNTIKYFNHDLSRDKFRELKLFTDFYYSRENGYKFIDYFEGAAADFWVRFNKKN